MIVWWPTIQSQKQKEIIYTETRNILLIYVILCINLNRGLGEAIRTWIVKAQRLARFKNLKFELDRILIFWVRAQLNGVWILYLIFLIRNIILINILQLNIIIKLNITSWLWSLYYMNIYKYKYKIKAWLAQSRVRRLNINWIKFKHLLDWIRVVSLVYIPNFKV